MAAPRKAAPRKSTPRAKAGPTPPRPRAVPAAAEPVLEPVELEDGTRVVFSFTDWLTKRGLLEDKPVEVGGRVFAFRSSTSATDNAQLFAHMATGRYREFLELMLVDASEVDELLGLMRVPIDTKAERELWLNFAEAIAGVTLGESPAS